MESKLENYDYPSLVMKYIPDQNLVRQIQINIDFVEKYLDRIEDLFQTVTEQQIMYKQLGSIAFSCTESLWKSLVLAVNAKCHANKCTEKNCEYRKFDSAKKLNSAKIKEIVDHLQNMRLILVTPFEMEWIEELQQLRNHVHLALTILDGDKSEKFNKDYVESMLRLYYVTLNQLELNQWHLEDEHACLKKLDENGYAQTQEHNKQEEKRFISDEIYYVTHDLFYGKEIPESRQRILKKLSSKQNYNEESLVDWIGRWLYYENIHFKTEESFQKAAEEYYTRLKEYLPQNSDVIQKLKQRVDYYHDLYNK